MQIWDEASEPDLLALMRAELAKLRTAAQHPLMPLVIDALERVAREPRTRVLHGRRRKAMKRSIARSYGDVPRNVRIYGSRVYLRLREGDVTGAPAGCWALVGHTVGR